MKIRKWTYELIVVVVVLLIGGAGWWFNSTKDERAASAQYEQLLKFANRQAVEIAIIEQRSKLLNYQQQINAANQPKTAQPIRPNPPMPAPFVPAVEPPVIADPNDISLEERRALSHPRPQ